MRRLLLLAPLLVLGISQEASAQSKNTGPTLAVPGATPATRPQQYPTQPSSPTLGNATSSESSAPTDPTTERLSQSLPLDPATKNLRDQLPADVPGTERQLGLREAHGQKTDLRGRTPSSREVLDALAPR